MMRGELLEEFEAIHGITIIRKAMLGELREANIYDEPHTWKIKANDGFKREKK